MGNLLKGCFGCFGLLVLVAAAVAIRWYTLPPATAVLESAVRHYTEHWDFDDLKADLDPANLSPESVEGWKGISLLLRERVGKVKAIQPFHLVRMAVNVNGTALATYETQATVARSGKQLTIRAGCNYSNGRWLISGLNFNGPDVLAPVAPAKH